MFLHIKKIITCYLIITMISVQTGVIFPSFSSWLIAEEQDSFTQRLAAAEEKYYSGEFDEAIKLASECLKEKNLTNEQKIQVYSLLAKAFMVKDNMDTARKLISRILEFKPDYHPTIEQETPRYVSLVEEALANRPEPAAVSKSNKWLWIGGGAVAVGALAAVLLSGGKDEDKGPQPLPAPPTYPED